MCIHIAGPIPWMAVGGAAGPVQPGKQDNMKCNKENFTITLAEWLRQLANMHEVIGSNPIFLPVYILVHLVPCSIYRYILVIFLPVWYIHVYTGTYWYIFIHVVYTGTYW